MGYIIRIIWRNIVPAKLKRFIKDLRKISSTTEEIKNLKKEVLYFKILNYYEQNNSKKYQGEIEYLKENGTLTGYLYKRTNKEIDSVTIGFDKKKKMPFVIHEDKRVYFPKNYSKETVKRIYLTLITEENILGGGFTEKSPHQYTTESFYVKKNDIVLDVGACEGLFLLDVIDMVKKGFVIESDKKWINALKATFEPYKDKVTIINKFASNKDSLNELTIDTCLKNDFGNIFIKMDVEGSENLVLQSALKVLNRKEDIRVSCCTYHRHDDASLIEDFFKGINYQAEFSDGYTLFNHYDKSKPPFFRRVLIRAKNIN